MLGVGLNSVSSLVAERGLGCMLCNVIYRGNTEVDARAI